MLWTLLYAANADVRLLNATGRPLTVDLGSEHGTLAGVALPPDGRFSETLGKALPDNTYETLVVKNAEGKELYRGRVVSRGNYLVVNWGAGVSVRAAGNFRGRSASANRVGLVNTLGEPFTYRVAYADLAVSDGKSAALHDKHAATYGTVGRHEATGSEAKLTIETLNFGTVSTSVVAGSVYVVRSASGSVRVELLSSP